MRTPSRTARGARRFSLAIIAAGVALTSAVPVAQADVRADKNWRLTASANPFRGNDQIALAVNPANPRHVVATYANYLTEECEGTASFDGGATWSDAFVLTPPAPGIGAPFLKSCRISNHLGESMFQTVAFGTGNNVYATSITPRTAAFGEAGSSLIVYKSTDGGVTWATATEAIPGGPSTASGPTSATGPYYELPSLAVDPGAGTGGADRIYVVGRDTVGTGNTVPPCAAAACSAIHSAVSNDGGQTFSARVQVSAAGVATAGPDGASEPVISPDGSVTVAWRTLGTAGSVQVARSTDGGATWSAPVTVTDVTAGGLAGNSHTTVALSSGSTFPRMAVDRQNGNLYIVYGQGPPGPTTPAGGYQGADHFINADSHVYFQRSRDNGATWSRPKLVNDNTSRPGSETAQTRHPSVSVAPNGRVDIVWEDRRHWYQGPGDRNCVHTHIACDDARLGDTYYAYSTNAGNTFTERRISDVSHNNDIGYDYRFGVGWGFGPRAVSLSSDELLVGWMDGREGNVDNDTLDIYLTTVRRGEPATAPQTKIDRPDAVSLSVALSQRAYAGGGEAVLASTFATRSATKVVIVNENDVAGALAGGVLARADLGSVLLSPAGGLPASVRAEVSRLRPAGAYVIGDTGQLSAQVEADLASAGVAAGNIVRVSGAGDAGTAAAIATRFDRRSPAEVTGAVPAFDAAVIANPAGPDAVAASALAAARRLPILYVDSGATAPAATTAALAALNIDRTLVIGGTGQVSSALMATLPSPKRLGGADQYATSKSVVAESVTRGLPGNIVYAASGARPMDAALLGFAVGRLTGNMVLSPGTVSQTASATAAAADLSAIDRIVVVEATAPVVAPPAPPPVAPAPPPAGTPTDATKLTAKLSLARATISRSARVLDVLAPITSLASGRADVQLHAAGQRYRFTAAINSRDGRIRFRKRIPKAQADLGTGIVTITYRGDADTRSQTVRLRAAARRADLRLTRPTLSAAGRLRASGTISTRARGVVRVQLEYVVDGSTKTRQFTARIAGGRWSVNEQLSQTIRGEIERRTGTVHSYTLFTGYLAARMRGEMRSFQILGPR